MINDDKARVTISIPINTLSEIDNVCKSMGVSRSQFIAVALGEKLMSYKQAVSFFENFGKEIIKSTVTE